MKYDGEIAKAGFMALFEAAVVSAQTDDDEIFEKELREARRWGFCTYAIDSVIGFPHWYSGSSLPAREIVSSHIGDWDNSQFESMFDNENWGA